MTQLAPCSEMQSGMSISLQLKNDTSEGIVRACADFYPDCPPLYMQVFVSWSSNLLTVDQGGGGGGSFGVGLYTFHPCQLRSSYVRYVTSL